MLLPHLLQLLQPDVKRGVEEGKTKGEFESLDRGDVKKTWDETCHALLKLRIFRTLHFPLFLYIAYNISLSSLDIFSLTYTGCGTVH